jgi:tetratricopeptide (TPR) repeat protein
MKYRLAPLRRLVPLLLLTAALGCGSAYGTAMKRGDDFAAAGLWDKAAAEYQRASSLDPSEPEAQIKLRQMRRRMSLERLARGKSLMARGEIAVGLAAIHEAVRLDPESADAQRALTEANLTALRKAEELLDADEGKKAFELTSLVLAGSPNDPRARDLDARVRERLAEQAYNRAEAFAAKGKLGNALAEFAASAFYRPAYKDAKLRVGQVRLSLEQELTFWVVLERFTDTGSGLGATLSPDLFGQSFDDKLPLKVVASLPGAAAASGGTKASRPAEPPSNVRGVKVWGKFDGYGFNHDKSKVGRTCDYVCGKDYVPNPQYAAAERAVGDAERQQAQADNEVARAQQEIDRAQQEVDRLQQELSRAEAEADRARSELDRCESQKKPDDIMPCSSERSRFESEQRDVTSLRERMASPRGALESARERLTSARDRSNTARQSRERATETMRSTPKQKEIDRMCAHNFDVDVHTVRARVTVQLSAAHLAGTGALLDAVPFEYRVEQQDEAREAHPNRCPALAQRDPLQLPSEKEVKQRLVSQAIAGLREKVLATHDQYRQRFLADARREEAAGLTEEAVESYVRYFLTGPRKLDPRDQKQIGDFLAKTRGFGKLEVLGGL